MHPSASQRIDPPAISHVPFLPARPRVDVVAPLLDDLETATTGGQRYVMDKVLVQLREAAAGAEHRLPDSERRTVRDTLAEMTRESERLLPNPDAFARRARMLAHTLSPA